MADSGSTALSPSRLGLGGRPPGGVKGTCGPSGGNKFVSCGVGGRSRGLGVPVAAGPVLLLHGVRVPAAQDRLLQACLSSCLNYELCRFPTLIAMGL